MVIEMSVEEAYIILELKSSKPTIDEIKKSFRRLAKKYHPDLSGKLDTSKFIKINNAYKILIEHLGKIGHFTVSEQSDINDFQSKIFVSEFIELISQLHNDLIALPQAIEGFIPSSNATQFCNILNDFFSEEVINSIKYLKSYERKRELINLLSSITAGHTLEFRKSFFNRIILIANGDANLEKMIKSTIYGIPSQFIDFFTNVGNSQIDDEEPYSSGDIGENQKFIYNSQIVQEFVIAFNQYSFNKNKAEDNYYDRPAFTIREASKMVKGEQAGEILFRRIKKKLKSDHISIGMNELKNLCKILGVISNLGQYMSGFLIKELSNDLGLENILIKLILESKLTSKEFSIILALFRFYLISRRKFPNLIPNNIKYNDYAKILYEIFIVYKISQAN
jgi:hypothetical protein